MAAERYARIQTPDGTLTPARLTPEGEAILLRQLPWLGLEETGDRLSPEQYQLLAPVQPGKIVAVGKNYAAHAAEMGGEVPAEPLLFLKATSAVIGPDAPICYPRQSQRVDYEGELALVIGQPCCDLEPEAAQAAIWGYTIANDVTARDLQQQDRTWARAKGFDSFCPLGPWIVRQVAPDVQIETRHNGQVVQSASIQDMVFSPAILVAYISRIMTLYPGDVILTGTPEGIGPVQPGDAVEVSIRGIGCLRNPVVQR
jgi:2-keto-4-pentenoate hydratase/2-oxohepta-3-ene-1,7-dioic acid hydratase in catechol pathway